MTAGVHNGRNESVRVHPTTPNPEAPHSAGAVVGDAGRAGPPESGAWRGRREMCEGRRPADASRAWWVAAAELRRREAAADAQLAAARARLAEALAELERARARAAEMQRRLEQTYGKRRRLVEEAQGRIHELRARLRHHQDRDREQEHDQQPPAGGNPSSSSPSSS